MDIGFNPKEPNFVATVGSDGWVRYFDLRTREREGHSTKLTHAGVSLTCMSFHEGVSGGLLFVRGVMMPLFLDELTYCAYWPNCVLTVMFCWGR